MEVMRTIGLVVIAPRDGARYLVAYFERIAETLVGDCAVMLLDDSISLLK